MINLNKSNLLTILSVLILVLGFQNCGDSSFQNIDSVQSEPASSLITSDTKYRGGLDFTVMSMSSSSSALSADFSVSKSAKDDYQIINSLTSYSCSFEDPNSSEELLQITEISTISHPSMVGTAFDVCDSSGGKDIFYAIGAQSQIYLTFKDEAEDCYSGDPQKLLDENLRVFVVDNLFISDIQDLLDAVKQDVLDDSHCAAFARIDD